MDYKIRQFKEKLVGAINDGELPLEVKRLCLQEILHEVNRLTEVIIEEQKKQSEVKEEDGNTSTEG